MMETLDIEFAHRLLSPRLTVLVGTRSESRGRNVIPISNVTSVSTSPQLLVVAVYREWLTADLLSDSSGFTVSIPTIAQLEGVWRLGSRYSGFPAASVEDKLARSGVTLDDSFSSYGPVVAGATGWLALRKVAEVDDLESDHAIIIGTVEKAARQHDHLDAQGRPKSAPSPVLQIVGNTFTSADVVRTVDFFAQDKHGGQETPQSPR